MSSSISISITVGYSTSLSLSLSVGTTTSCNSDATVTFIVVVTTIVVVVVSSWVVAVSIDSLCCYGCCSEAAVKAMRVCARNLFVPEQQQDEAFLDSPIRLEELDFNVSAPHMHASCLEALQLQPGHSLLDVGCGCDIINACGAYIVRLPKCLLF